MLSSCISLSVCHSVGATEEYPRWSGEGFARCDVTAEETRGSSQWAQRNRATGRERNRQTERDKERQWKTEIDREREKIIYKMLPFSAVCVCVTAPGSAGWHRLHPGTLPAKPQAPPTRGTAGGGRAMGGASSSYRAEGGGAKTGQPALPLPEHGEKEWVNRWTSWYSISHCSSHTFPCVFALSRHRTTSFGAASSLVEWL